MTDSRARLASVNIGAARPIGVKSGSTGFFKRPKAGQVAIGRFGLAGDTIVDTQNHSGVDQAVYLFDADDRDWWAAALGRDLPPGAFGENLSVSGLPTQEVALGDRLMIGEVVLEVTSPRIPCVTLGAVFGDPGLPKRFLASGRCGYYARVLSAGDVAAGMPVGWQRFETPRCAVTDLLPGAERPAGHVARLLATPLHHLARRALEAEPGADL